MLKKLLQNNNINLNLKKLKNTLFKDTYNYHKIN